MTIFALLFSSLFIGFSSWAAPTILYAGTDISELRDNNDTMTFSIVASDPQGVEKLAGAVLIDNVSSSTYGSFSTGDIKGAYSLSLSYRQFARVRPVYPEPDSGEVRALHALVFNAHGEKVRVDFSVVLNSGVQYHALAPNLFATLPQEWQSTLNQKWRNYSGSQEFDFFANIGATYDKKKDITRISGYEGTEWNLLYTKSGKEGYFDFIKACEKVEGHLEHSESVDLCRFTLRCIRTNAAASPMCWKQRSN